MSRVLTDDVVHCPGRSDRAVRPDLPCDRAFRGVTGRTPSMPTIPGCSPYPPSRGQRCSDLESPAFQEHRTFADDSFSRKITTLDEQHSPTQDWSAASRSADMAGRLEILFLLSMLLCANCGCATAIYPESPPPELREGSSESSDSSSIYDLIGVWKGGSLCRWSRIGTSCRGAVNIAFTLLPAVRSKMTGFYSCETSSVGCRHRLDHGAITTVEIDGKRPWLRVMLDDGSSCLFTSRFRHDRMAGGYECLQGALLVEQGQWWVELSY